MSLAAVISRKPALTIEEWKEVVAQTDHLEPDQAVREIVNPFTRRPSTVRAAEGSAKIVIGGKSVGAIEPSSEFAEDGELNVFAPSDDLSDAFRHAVAAIAAKLGAHIEWAPETGCG